MFATFLSRRLSLDFESGQERTLKIKKNIFYTFLIKGGSVLSGFMLVPLTIQYINPAQYGIWIIISSLIAWLNTFDIGLSNGLRNKLASDLAVNEQQNIVKYISTTYALLFFIASALFSLLCLATYFIDLNSFFNVQGVVNFNIRPAFLITAGAFCLQFILQPVNSILTAIHQPFKASLLLFAGQLLTLVVIYIIHFFIPGNLYTVIIIASFSPVLVMLSGSIYLFKRSLKAFSPKFKFVDFSVAKDLLSIGGIFFVIQLGALILYETDNIIIAKTLSPAEVTAFNIAFKYFSISILIFTIIITPFWSAFTDAYAKKDIVWMRHSIKKMQWVWLVVSVLSVSLFLLSSIVYKVWIGDKIIIPGLLSLLLAVFAIVQNWMNIYAFMLNGIGKLRVQLILIVFAGIINIPLSVVFIHQIGIAGTVLANIVVFFLLSIGLTYQCNLILTNKVYGIWNK